MTSRSQAFSASPAVRDRTRPGLGKFVSVPGGFFMMGSETFYPEERPQTETRVKPFNMMTTPVLNIQFERFVAETHYVSSAERGINIEDEPGFPADYYNPGSMVFSRTDGPVPLNDPRRWWRFVEGASWRTPEGPGSSIVDRMDHPVVHVSLTDAQTYAAWADARLPHEAEWEWAAHGGSKTLYPWGDQLSSGSGPPVNIWTGSFPWSNDRHGDGPYTTLPRQYPENGYGLFDMIGNVWEWTDSPSNNRFGGANCCASSDLGETAVFVVKGGSFLCAESYCQRYRPTARMLQAPDATASNIGFRLASSE